MNYAVIMGGGKGTRFWPKSTQKKPKQFLAFQGAESLLHRTVKRLKPLIPARRIYLIGSKQYHQRTCKELFDIPHSNIIAEPVGKNTAPCLGLASILLKQRDPHAVLVALPADAVIKKEKQFRTIVNAASQMALRENVFVTIGIAPRYPHTGYGYIQRGKQYKRVGGKIFYSVKRFVEKPSLKKARGYIASQSYLWNSGMFVFNVTTMLTAIKKNLPHLYTGLCSIEKALGTKRQRAVINRIFRSLRPVSVDCGIMEKVSNVVLVKGDIGWNDVGSWSALDEIIPKDKHGNVISGKVIGIESTNNIIDAESKLIALVGVRDTIVVQAGDVVLVAQKAHAQNVKKIVDNLNRKKLTSYL